MSARKDNAFGNAANESPGVDQNAASNSPLVTIEKANPSPCVTPTPDASSQEQISHSQMEEEEEEYCNPEPPPELVEGHLLDADNIGNTVFSKRWVLNTLMRLIQTVDGQHEGKDGTEDEVDIDEELQDELCKLWDMSMNAEVVSFLQEYKAVDILIGVIAKSKAPRATEICVGILGNMACSTDVCQQLADNDKYIDMLLMLLETPDTQTLVETTRLLHVCLSHEATNAPWLAAINRDDSVYTRVVFILHSSTNMTLLQNTGELTDKVMYLEEGLCSEWSKPQMVEAVLESTRQSRSSGGGDAMETFLHILQLMSTCSNGVQALVEYGSELMTVMLTFLQTVCEDEVVILSGRENSLGSALSVVNVLLPAWANSIRLIDQDFQLTRCVLKILDAVYPKHDPDSAEQLRLQRQKYDQHHHDKEVEGVLRRRRTVSETGHSPLQSTNPFAVDSVRAGNTPINTVNTPVKNPDPEEAWRTPFTRSSVCQSERGEAGTSGGGGDRVGGAYSATMIRMLYEVLHSCVVEIVQLLPKLNSSSQASENSTPILNGDAKSSATNGTSDNQTDSNSKEESSSDTQETMDQQSSQQSNLEAVDSPKPYSNPLMPQTLDYLETMCLKSRIQYLVKVLKRAEAENGEDLLQMFLDCILKYNLERVRRIVRSA